MTNHFFTNFVLVNMHDKNFDQKKFLSQYNNAFLSKKNQLVKFWPFGRTKLNENWSFDLQFNKNGAKISQK